MNYKGWCADVFVQVGAGRTTFLNGDKQRAMMGLYLSSNAKTRVWELEVEYSNPCSVSDLDEAIKAVGPDDRYANAANLHRPEVVAYLAKKGFDCMKFYDAIALWTPSTVKSCKVAHQLFPDNI